MCRALLDLRAAPRASCCRLPVPCCSFYAVTALSWKEWSCAVPWDSMDGSMEEVDVEQVRSPKP